MICNIRRLSTWEHLASLTALDWELPLWAEDDEQGRVTIFGEQPDYSGQWACINGGLFFISGSAPDSGSTKLTLRLPRYAFSRELPYSGTGSETYGEFIAGILTAEYIGQADAEYAMPYLSVSNTDKTAFTFPVESGKLYALSDIWTAAEKAGVRFVFSTAPEALTLTVETGEPKTVNLFSGNAGVIVSSRNGPAPSSRRSPCGRRAVRRKTGICRRTAAWRRPRRRSGSMGSGRRLRSAATSCRRRRRRRRWTTTPPATRSSFIQRAPICISATRQCCAPAD